SEPPRHREEKKEKNHEDTKITKKKGARTSVSARRHAFSPHSFFIPFFFVAFVPSWFFSFFSSLCLCASLVELPDHAPLDPDPTLVRLGRSGGVVRDAGAQVRSPL